MSMSSSHLDQEAGRASAPSKGQSLADLWCKWRDGILTNPGFVRWATRFPLTRPMAVRRARSLFDLCAGFVYTQTLTACVRLDVFGHLKAGPMRADELAPLVGLPVDGMVRLLNAAHSLNLVEPRSSGRFGLGPLGAAVVGNPDVQAMVRHHGLLYGDLSDPVALLRGETGETALNRFWGYARSEQPEGLVAQDVGDYSALMAASQTLIAQSVLDAYSIKPHSCLMDVGGGDGTFICAAAERSDSLSLMLADLPAVAERAEKRFAERGFADRISAVGLDFFKEPLPEGADVISLVRIIHDHDDDEARAILRAVRRALPPGGTLLLAEPMAGTRGAEPIGGAYFEFYLLAMGSGRPRTPQELETMLVEAGFCDIRPRRTAMPLFARLLVARADPSWSEAS